MICVASVIGTVYGVSSKAGGQRRERGKSSQAAAQGKEIYAANCARCHGVDGHSRTTLGQMVSAPDLTDAQLLGDLSNGRIETLIMRGRGGMPAFGTKLTRKEVADVAAYVR
ncbi:MAG: cytochrome c, partial [Acidobacteria bacterium]|nr:cytochrome c [Acidobacteriota bacterium]